MDPLKDFPLMASLNPEFTEFDGFISAQREYRFHLKLKKQNSVFNAIIKGNPSSNVLLKRLKPQIKAITAKNVSLESFLKWIHSKILEEEMNICQVTPGNGLNHLKPHDIYGSLTDQLEQIGLENVFDYDSQLKHIKLSYIDASNRQHFIKCLISDQFPNVDPEVEVDFPIKFKIESKIPSLLNNYNEFKNMVNNLQCFWDEVDEIEDQTIVVKPVTIKYSTVNFCFILNKGLLMSISINPLAPRSPPDHYFIGPPALVTEKLSKVFESLESWDEEYSVIDNIRSMLSIKLPSNAKKEAFDVECGICLEILSNDELPSVFCSERKCYKPYHQRCLFLLLMKNCGKIGYGTAIGKCSYCKTTISCKEC